MTTLSLPTLTRGNATQCNFALMPNTQTFESPLNRAVQTYELPGARWLLSATWQNLKEADARIMKAWLAKLRGAAGRFYAGDLAHKIPSGVVYGTGSVYGASQTGRSLITHWIDPSAPELITNGGFDSVTTGWTPEDCTLASVAGGQAGKCLEITMTGGAVQYVGQSGLSFTAGELYEFSVYVKSGTSGNEPFRIIVSHAGDTTHFFDGNSTGSWVKHSLIVTANGTEDRVYIVKNSATAGTMLFDTASLKQTTHTRSNWLVPGDYFSVNNELKIITDAITLTAGACTLTFEPPLRSSPADNAAITYSSPTAIFRLNDDKQDAFNFDPDRHPSITISATEAFA